MPEENILILITGDYVAKAVQQLPPPDSVAETVMETALEVPRIGLVRFTATKKEARHHRSRHRFWAIGRAVRISE